MAERLGIGDEHVPRSERGAVLPKLPRLIDIAEAFELGVDKLFTGASPHFDGQAIAMAHRLGHLSAADRAFVVAIVDRLVGRLASQPESRPRRL